ncbi:MAG: hypothetical protein ACREQE_05860, partial [Candidatus Binataceae bacterium]
MRIPGETIQDEIIVRESQIKPDTGNPNPNRPRHFHLLWSEELDALRPILKVIRDRLDDVLSHWYDFYLLHFGDERTLTQGEFHDIFHDGLARTTSHLLAGDIDSYSAAVIQTGELLAERRVPFSEAIASLHLYEESVSKVLPDPLPLRTYTTFDKLSHIRMILLADAYFRSESAVAGARIRALEREAARIGSDDRRGFHGLIGA